MMENQKTDSTLKILWFQFVAFIIMIFGLSYYLTLKADPLDGATFMHSNTHKTLIGIGVFFAFMSFVIPNSKSNVAQPKKNT